MEPNVDVVQREACPVISRRVLVNLSTIGQVISSAFQEVYGFIGRLGIAPAGPPFVIYHGSPRDGESFEIEVCAPILRGSAGAPEGWQARELPAGRFATLVHVGPYDTLGAAYAAIEGWLAAHEVPVVGPPREVYLSEPGTPPDRVTTIIEFPIAEVAVPVAAP